MFIVNARTGELCHRLNGPRLPGPFAVDFSRAYTSSSSFTSPMGLGWNVPYDIRLERDDAQLALVHGADEMDRFDVSSAHASEVKGQEHLARKVGPLDWIVVNQSTQLTYYFHGRGDALFLVKLNDAYENQITIERDAIGRMLRIVDAFKRRLDFSYQGEWISEIQLVTGARQQVSLLQCGYDRVGCLIWISSDAGIHRSTYEYEMGKLVAHTNPLGGRTCARYDELSRCVQLWEEQGSFSRSFFFDSIRNVTRVIDSHGHSTLYRFDDDGGLKEKVDALGGSTTYVRDENGSLIAELNPLGEASAMYHAEDSASGRNVTKTSADGSTTTLELDVDGKVAAVTDACGGRWAYQRETGGKISGLISPLQRSSRVEYDKRGRFSQISGPGDQYVRHSWSDDGREHTVTDAIGTVSETQFDPLGRIVRFRGQRGAGYSVRYEGMKQVVENIDGTTRRYEADAMGNVVLFVDELDSNFRLSYDVYGRLLTVAGPTGPRTSWRYDAEGQVASIMNATGQELQNDRDPLGRIVQQTGFDGCRREYTYDSAGRLVAKKDGNGDLLAIVPDGMGRPSIKKYADGSVVEIEYGIEGRLARATDNDGTIEFQVDAEYRTTTEKSEGGTFQFEYDWQPYPIAMQHIGGRRVNYEYDTRSSLKAVSEGADLRIDFDRDADLRFEDVRFRSGLRVRRLFDTRGRVMEQRVDSRGGECVFSILYEYDARSNRVAMRRTGREPISFGHDADGRLQSVMRGRSKIREYAYDANGNPLRVPTGAAKYEPGDRVDVVNDRSWNYDGEGRPLGEERGGWERMFRYDARGRLIETQANTREFVEYTYDYLFRRTRKRVGEQNETTIWAGDGIFEQRCADGTFLEYVVNPVDNTPLAVRIDGVWHAIVCDQRGEVTDVICLSTEQVVWSCEPLGFDWETRVGDNTFCVAIRGHGQLFDAETGYCYQRARYFEPSLARFLMPDPIGYHGGLNVYQYCLNQPFLFTDPLGLAPCPLSEDDCNDIFDNIEQRSSSVNKRWDDMVANKLDLPWDGMPGKGQPVAVAAVGAALGTPWPVGADSMGSIDSHITAYEQEQSGMNRRIQDYYAGGCSKYEDSNRAAAMEQHADIASRPISCPSLGF